MGQSAVQAAQNVNILHKVPRSQIEITPMIGRNDLTHLVPLFPTFPLFLPLSLPLPPLSSLFLPLFLSLFQSLFQSLFPPSSFSYLFSQITTLADVDTITNWAKNNDIIGHHIWSFDRDTPCPQSYADATCSSVTSPGTLAYQQRYLSADLD